MAVLGTQRRGLLGMTMPERGRARAWPSRLGRKVAVADRASSQRICAKRQSVRRFVIGGRRAGVVYVRYRYSSVPGHGYGVRPVLKSDPTSQLGRVVRRGHLRGNPPNGALHRRCSSTPTPPDSGSFSRNERNTNGWLGRYGRLRGDETRRRAAVGTDWPGQVCVFRRPSGHHPILT